MNTQFLTLYVLFLPMVATGILITLCLAVYRDTQVAKAQSLSIERLKRKITLLSQSYHH